MHKKNQYLVILLLITLANIQQAQAQTNPHFNTFCHWMAGTWHGQGFGGTTEETWSPPTQQEMVGTFRHFDKDGKTTFYEFFRMNQKALELKHFSPSFEGWEEKQKYISFPFVKATPTSLVFEGISYIKKGPHTMEVVLQIKQKGKVTTHRLIFKRKLPNWGK